MNPDRASRQRRRAAVLCCLVALVVGATAACGGDAGTGSNGAAVPAGDTITMRLIAFRPEDLAVDAGTTVKWVQRDAGAHTVTSGTVAQGDAGVTAVPDGKFDSGEITTGETFEFTFDEAGTFRYFCDLHPATMRGAVKVR